MSKFKFNLFKKLKDVRPVSEWQLKYKNTKDYIEYVDIFGLTKKYYKENQENNKEDIMKYENSPQHLIDSSLIKLSLKSADSSNFNLAIEFEKEEDKPNNVYIEENQKMSNSELFGRRRKSSLIVGMVEPVRYSFDNTNVNSPVTKSNTNEKE